jgi:hypothetical protein
MRLTSLGSPLARLGGANPDVLAQVTSAKSRFIQMGLVLLSTAGLAVVSMSFALIDGLGMNRALAILGGLVWGFVILNLDRVLIQNIRAASSIWRTAAMVLPRLVIAGLLGIVIATPLVLRTFASEIQAEMDKENAQHINEVGQIRRDSPDAKRLADVIQRISADQAVLAGQMPPATSPNVTAARDNLGAAQKNLAAKRAAAQDAYDQMICELDGNRCHGASGKHGPGPRYQALRRLYGIAATDEADAQKAVANAQQALDDANKAAAATNSGALAQAQDRARAELPGLTAERDRLQSELSNLNTTDLRRQSKDTGLLARIQALNRLGHDNSSAFWAHWAVAGLLFMIELLPVLVKLLATAGPPTVYDRVSELQDDSAYDAATQQRNIYRRQIEEDSKKRRAIEDDMRKREVRLGIKANAHVASKMEEILDAALEQWNDEVARTLHKATNAAHNAGPASTWAPPPQVGPHTSDSAVSKKYNLPNGGSL